MVLTDSLADRKDFLKIRFRFYAFCTSAIIFVIGISLAISQLAAQLTSRPEPRFSTSLDSGYYLISFIMAALGATGGAFFWSNKFFKNMKFDVHEAFFIITFCWSATSLIGAIPFLFEKLPIDNAILESFSLFTTTGTQISADSPISNTLIFYECICAWLGGMGTISLLLVFLPMFSQKEMLPYAEAAGVKSSDRRASSRVGRSASRIFIVYLLLTAIDTLLLIIVSPKTLTCFDAICYALTTLSTSGVPPGYGTSIFNHNMAAIWVTIIFMVLASFNFNVYVVAFSDIVKRIRYGKHAGTQKASYVLFNDETKFFLFACLGGALLISLQLLQHNKSLHNICDIITSSVFAAVSFMSTTGFVTNVDFELQLSSASVILLLILCMFGGCSGSTAAGLKNYRCIILFKYAVAQIRHIVYPRQVMTIYLNHERRDSTTVNSVVSFFVLYIMILMTFALAIAVCSPYSFKPFPDAFALSFSALTNTGLVCSVSGIQFNAFELTWVAKALLIVEMILGRLELYTVLVLFVPRSALSR